MLWPVWQNVTSMKNMTKCAECNKSWQLWQNVPSVTNVTSVTKRYKCNKKSDTDYKSVTKKRPKCSKFTYYFHFHRVFRIHHFISIWGLLPMLTPNCLSFGAYGTMQCNCRVYCLYSLFVWSMILLKPTTKLYLQEKVKIKALISTLDCLTVYSNWIWDGNFMEITIQSSQQMHN